MTATRREFLSAGMTAGAALLAACSGSSSEPPRDPPAAPPPAPPPVPPPAAAPPPAPPLPPDPGVAMQRLQAHLRDNASAAFALPEATPSAPVITWAGALNGSHTAATTLPNGTVIDVSSPLIGGALRERASASLPGGPIVDGFPCRIVTRPYERKGIARNISTLTLLHLKTDAPVFELAGVVADGGATSQTLIVDGKLVEPQMLSSGRGGGGWTVGAIRFDFGTRATRDIWLETGMYPAYLRIGAGDTLFPAVDDGVPQLTVIGDSYLQSRSITFANGGAIAFEIGARLGIRKVATDAIGGTGYWNSGVDLGNLNDRLPAHGADGSTIYLVMAGINDYGDVENNPLRLVWPTRDVYEESVRGYLRELRAAQPEALIVVTAPFCPVPPMSDASYVANPETNTSGLGDYLYKAALHKGAVQDIAGPWVYIDVLMGTGWLNSSGATGDVTDLQWFTGGTPGPGTTATYRPGHTHGGGGGAYGGIERVPIVSGGRYTQAPEVHARGGSGRGLLLSSAVDATGTLTAVHVAVEGYDYSSGSGLPTIEVDSRFEITPAVLAPPELVVPVNANGQYPLASFAPPGVDESELNNIPRLMSADTIHPSPVGVEYLSRRLAENIYAAVMAL